MHEQKIKAILYIPALEQGRTLRPHDLINKEAMLTSSPVTAHRNIQPTEDPQPGHPPCLPFFLENDLPQHTKNVDFKEGSLVVKVTHTDTLTGKVGVRGIPAWIVA